MSKRDLYLKNTDPEEAFRLFAEALGRLSAGTETVRVTESQGRVTSEAVMARLCSPLYNAAAMDGIAVVSAATADASEERPALLKKDIDYVEVDTGDPVKPPYDAVIMAEDVEEAGADTVRIRASVHGWQHLRPVGEDIAAGEMIVPTAHRITPCDMGALLSGGITSINVIKTPKVAVIPTGDEIVAAGSCVKEGDIIDSNSAMLAGLVRDSFGIPEVYPVIKDLKEDIKSAILKAVSENDAVLVSAGSSAGRDDYTASAIRELGNVVLHGVAVKPGKPVILGIVAGKPVIGLPGYPVSAYIAFMIFASPIIKALSEGKSIGGGESRKTNTIEAVVSGSLVSSLKYREYVRVRVGRVGDRYVAAPLARGAGAAMSLVRSDGFLVIQKNSEGVLAGEICGIEIFKDMSKVDRTLVSIGSHDMIMDVIADILESEGRGYGLVSTHVGSMGGLMALKRMETTIAPTHLLDAETGIYNIAYLKELFPDEEMALIKGVDRIQGMMVKKGNPLGIKEIGDLTRVNYVNRQRGSGTRVLLDYLLKKTGTDPGRIKGYEKEAATHMAVAAAVKDGGCDAGMGIKPAADSFGLDFIETGHEEYDFAVRKRDLSDERVKAFLEVLTGERFRRILDGTGAYGCRNIGKIVLIRPEARS